ncbi:DUF2523 domain-containing protein [Vibrio parahaemolyticus]|uniref:DUF2523 family protein n=1 Tax=Vibrio parahaemolyticus TaxID=670 RepID=UPI00084B1D25|nr:DUF2523 family protein [Vibrio parahaemolyticus]EGQ8852978.1 DUF2523 domain-containing protein [Vibrio parahaemolyticus]EGQ8857639.1 DUF2523 domain-containing protein [Vibrio parahaemolyticus]EGQ8877106.1 DUF2523 domain-containing protein [Vibrio parahaemolyticus]EGQ8996296.1 DUF2523 domain-containing protein [Vibrio parahaemolyticus]EGQ9030491.1 DUF2523 domain-containing protein [Vibrio parahaemolyticus]
MTDFFQLMANFGDTIYNYLTNMGNFFDQIMVWLQTWWIKMKLMVAIEFLKASYLVATSLLDEIGFSALFSQLFNLLPSELRYWGVLFKVPEGMAIYVNCATTALVMRMSR